MSEFFAGLGQAFGYGGTVAIIGLLIVFVGLCILIGFLLLMSVYFKRLNQNSEPKAISAPAIVTAPIEETPPPDEEAYADSGELIAAIAAAIQMFDESGKTLVVKSVRRVNGWKNAARAEQVYKL